jgi:hypothetical protein
MHKGIFSSYVGYCIVNWPPCSYVRNNSKNSPVENAEMEIADGKCRIELASSFLHSSTPFIVLSSPFHNFIFFIHYLTDFIQLCYSNGIWS